MQKRAFFLKRLNDHVQYLNKMKGRLAGANTFEPTTCRICTLGQWLHGEGTKEAGEYGDTMLTLFRALFEPHERFHQASAEALHCQQTGDELGMHRALTEMHTLSSQLVGILLKMDAVPAPDVSNRHLSQHG
ncbi:CZB domain-containing protein [Thiothrix subterranea]|uniref:CZB domain-containing protein n=1 Tax=Thiothrix subterranea TaxID=2735563 RepID=A0AA51R2G9_9GAMM|nr:CZB domain-containing protein [Thiothrix subterranea]MDQ5768292.1 CZB domain-containing protein [Thiothrix subterranea]WML87819.1 CZB domain-containing protein [Thiothrix subterranea]